MNEIKIYAKRRNHLILLVISFLCMALGAWLLLTQVKEMRLAQGLIVGGGVGAMWMMWRLFRRRPRISLTVHGIQFHYPTERSDASRDKTPLFNQFVAWDDIQAVQLQRYDLQLYIDDNPPDYERLTEIELANLPPREMVLYQLTAAIGGLNVPARHIADWLTKIHQADAKERSALLLSFYYEQ